MNNKEKLTEATINLLKESIPPEDNPRLTHIDLYVSDPNKNIQRLLEYISSLSTAGHSFQVTVDQGDSEFEKSFGIDGDGCDQIVKVKASEKVVKK